MQVLRQHIESFLKVKVSEKSVIEQAFYHRSYVNDKGWPSTQSNERLEFLGDAVLEILVSQFLYQTYSEKPEGDLSRMRAQLVREPSLAYLARQAKFPEFIRLGKGEALSGGAQRESILADCFEAFLGAVYLDQGLEEVNKFLDRVLFQHHLTILQTTQKDYKTQYQELVQVHGSVSIRYEVLKQEGPAHKQLFTIGLYLEDQLMAQGQGRTKKEAEMEAAKLAIQNHGKEDSPCF